MKAVAIIAALCVGLAAAHTQEEIERKGIEVMEEYRRDRGHWIFLNAINMVDHMTDHLGGNGLAVAGFFITKKFYAGETGPGEETQMRDPLFKEFKSLAQSQGKWIPSNLRHKTWTFGYSHDKEIAQNVGCDDIGTWEWNPPPRIHDYGTLRLLCDTRTHVSNGRNGRGDGLEFVRCGRSM